MNLITSLFYGIYFIAFIYFDNYLKFASIAENIVGRWETSPFTQLYTITLRAIMTIKLILFVSSSLTNFYDYECTTHDIWSFCNGVLRFLKTIDKSKPRYLLALPLQNPLAGFPLSVLE